MRSLTLATLIGAAAVVAAAHAQNATAPAPATATPAAPAPAPTAAAPATSAQSSTDAAAPAKAPDSLVLYFESGSAALRAQDLALLDQASRLYRDGHPIVMIVAGSTDTVGQPAANLSLSERRAQNVVQGLIARGIPAERFQVLGKGETDPAVRTAEGVAEPHNRRVEITWR